VRGWVWWLELARWAGGCGGVDYWGRRAELRLRLRLRLFLVRIFDRGVASLTRPVETEDIPDVIISIPPTFSAAE
jgi:hypothetical protein